MRQFDIFAVLSLPLAVASLQLPFSFDWIYPASNKNSLSTDVIPHKIAIIGAGAGGSSAAFWIAKAKERTQVVVEIDVYEREGYVGGRSTTVFPYNDSSLDPVELGASIFVVANKNLWRATEEFNLTRKDFDDDSAATGLWDGEELIFTMNEYKGYLGWIDNIKFLWRYGYMSVRKTEGLVKKMIEQFLWLYKPDTPRWTNITDLASQMGWTEMISQSTSEYLDLMGVSRKFSREIVEAATRVNYAQNIDKIHTLEGLCSIAASGASSVKGGNFQIFQNLLARSGANLYMNTTVVSLDQTEDRTWALRTSGSNEVKLYNDVVITGQFHSTGISFNSLVSIPPPQPYVHLHVTLLTTTAPHPSPIYFGLKEDADVPRTVLTTYEGVRKGGKDPEFNSVNYLGPITPGSDEYVVKIFSEEALSDEWLHTLFGGNVGWIYRKEWDAYPRLPPTTSFPPVVLAPGIYYVNAFEPFISTMETETISSRNIVDLLFRERFGSDICGKSVRSVQVELNDEGEQTVLPEETNKTEHKAVDDDFVLGWDC